MERKPKDQLAVAAAVQTWIAEIRECDWSTGVADKIDDDLKAVLIENGILTNEDTGHFERQAFEHNMVVYIMDDEPIFTIDTLGSVDFLPDIEKILDTEEWYRADVVKHMMSLGWTQKRDGHVTHVHDDRKDFATWFDAIKGCIDIASEDLT